MSTETQLMRRTEIREIFGRHKGSKVQFCRDLGIAQGTLSDWFAGRMVSERIHAALNAKALTLLEQERANV